jgi:hypothetical protein
MMKLFAAAAVAAVMLASPAQAQAPAAAPAPAPSANPSVTAVSESAMRLGREIVEASGIARSFDSVMPDIALRIRGNFSNTRPEILKDMDDTLVALLPEIRTRRAEMIERSARSLAGLFTEPEMREMLAFFNSATGKKYVNAQPQLLQVIFQAMEPWVQQTSDFFLTRFREEMRKKGHTL